MIVIATIGIPALIAIPNFRFQARSKQANPDTTQIGFSPERANRYDARLAVQGRTQPRSAT